MKDHKIAILGATGVVGQEMIKILAERNFPVSELVPLASARSVGKEIRFKDRVFTVKEAGPDAYKGCDIVLGAAENDISKANLPYILDSGAVYIDNSSAFRLDPEVPLVVPELNADDVKMHKGIVANPNCVTIIAAVAMAPILSLSKIKTLVASSYQAVSGAGAKGLFELEKQARDYPLGKDLEISAFKHQILFNLIPKIGSVGENGYSSEEMKLQNEGRKIMHLPDLKVCCTCVRVPVLRSHSISIRLVTEDKLSVDQIKEAVLTGKGVKLYDDAANEIYPMPLAASDQDLVYVGRIRKDLINENGIALWCCGDQIRKGAATNAVQIAELL